MFKSSAKKCIKVFLTSVVLAGVCGSFAFAKPKNDLVKEEAGYYYGYGKAETKEEADFLAKKNLVENALTAVLHESNPEADHITVTDEVVKARIGDMKPFAKSKNELSVCYRIKDNEWAKNEKAYAESLRKVLTPKYQTLTTKGSVADKIATANEIITTLAENGETDILTMQEKSTEIMARKVEAVCSAIADNIVLTIEQKDGFINSTTTIAVSAKDKGGNAIAGLQLKAVFEQPYLAISMEDDELAESVSIVTTDAKGNATVEYPVDEEYKNRVVNFTLTTTFSLADKTTTGMRAIDGQSCVEGRFYCIDDVKEVFKTVEIAAGNYTTGAVATDARATGKEEARKAKLAKYEMCVAPVTNGQYAIYLFLTRNDETPEYFDNDDYNQPDLPVIGVTVENANAYAAWLSEQTGAKFRLPTDDEWEVAAHAGTEYVYPWGDDDPSKGKKANYKGNGKFKKPSPVGSFDNGNNAWGLTDMAGNVWEWTSSARNAESNPSMATVKGGSWMDGPVDLRISNFKNVNKERGYPDVGFRLVRQ
ncbi:MAG: SUMF1/EgtB/PvdO family nonheme iron enzyme [Treponema sp.]|nr:SUMF1/EgtB/PvdO family nonheme iron enzyme [Candidatus Treponema scatequi]